MGRFIVKILLMTSIVIITSSCKVQKVDIIGRYGTEIYDYKKNKIAEIPSTGRVTVEISKKYDDLPMFLSYDRNVGVYVPFAFNFEKKSTKEVLLWTTWPTAPLLFFGPFLYVAADVGNSQFVNHFKYLPEQQTNHDIVFTPLKQTADYKTVGKKRSYLPSYETVDNNKDKKEEYLNYTQREERTVVDNNASNTYKSQPARTESVNHSQHVIGTYYGTGRLMSDNELIERYDNLKIVVTKRTDNMVKVDIYVNSIPYFSSTNIYNISKTYNEYTLHHTTNDSYITVDEDGKLDFTYKNIRNKGYVLKINAEKE
ncbi:MAG: hypothetical protein IJE47_03920 [Bacteroidales bacterium]|nr:hypothetical protein [Bacteroidales bacterium]